MLEEIGCIQINANYVTHMASEKLFLVVCFAENRCFLEINAINEQTVNENVRWMKKCI